MKIAHVYALYDPRKPEVVRYVGRTSKPLQVRLREHINDAKADRSRSYRISWVKSLLAQGVQPALLVLEETTLEEVVTCEAKWIARMHAAKQPLCNHTFGYEGPLSGGKRSDVTLSRMSAAQRARYSVRANRDAMREPVKAFFATPEGKVIAKERVKLMPLASCVLCRKTMRKNGLPNHFRYTHEMEYK